MSWQATAYVAELTDGISRSEKLLLMCLANRHNIDKNTAWLAIPRLAREALMSEATAYRTLKSLEEKRLVSVVRRPGRSSEYTIAGLEPTPVKPPTPRKMRGVSNEPTPVIAMTPLPLSKIGVPLSKQALTPVIAMTPLPLSKIGVPLSKQALTPVIAMTPEQRTVLEPNAEQTTTSRARVDAIASAFARYGTVTASTTQAIGYSIEDYGVDWCEKAVRKAAGASYEKPPPWTFIESWLERWKKNGGPDDARLQEHGRTNGRSSGNGAGESIADGYARYAAGQN